MADKKTDNKSGPEKVGVIDSAKAGAAMVRAFIVKVLFWSFFFFTASVLVAAFTPLANRLAATLIVEEELKTAEIIAVLGGGAYRNKILSGASNERMIHGLRLYKAGLAPRIAFLGGTITDTGEKVASTLVGTDTPDKVDVVEGELMGKVALEFGLPEGSVIVDKRSTNTHANIEALSGIMRERGLKRCLVVTGPLHMYRAKRVYEKMGLDCWPAPAGDYTHYVDSAVGRLALLRRVLWEYAAIVLYRSYDFI